MFPGLGTVINVSAILLGTLFGVGVGDRFRPDIRELLTETLGFVTILAGVDTLRSFWDPSLASILPKKTLFLFLLVALVLGTLIGKLLNIETHLFTFGEKAKRKSSSRSSCPRDSYKRIYYGLWRRFSNGPESTD